MVLRLWFRHQREGGRKSKYRKEDGRMVGGAREKGKAVTGERWALAHLDEARRRNERVGTTVDRKENGRCYCHSLERLCKGCIPDLLPF